MQVGPLQGFGVNYPSLHISKCTLNVLQIYYVQQ
jgi:hypothetical protein